MKTKEQLMPYVKFKAIMKILQDFQEQKERISKFFEKELMQDSWCIFTLGNDVESALVNLLADEFECWYSFKEDYEVYDWWNTEDGYRGFENDIENWLYTISDEPKTVTLNKEEIPIDSIEELYDFLVKQYELIHKDDLTVK